MVDQHQHFIDTTPGRVAFAQVSCTGPKFSVTCITRIFFIQGSIANFPCFPLSAVHHEPSNQHRGPLCDHAIIVVYRLRSQGRLTSHPNPLPHQKQRIQSQMFLQKFDSEAVLRRKSQSRKHTTNFLPTSETSSEKQNPAIGLGVK